MYSLVIGKGGPKLKGFGLKLEPAKASVETLVIDHMERPTEN